MLAWELVQKLAVKKNFLFLQIVLLYLTLLGNLFWTFRLRPTAKDVQNNANLLAPSLIVCKFRRMACVLHSGGSKCPCDCL